jgi:hypothetical protein
MDWDAIGAVGEIIGATAVFITLIYLAMQVRQSNHQNMLKSFQHTHDAANAFCRLISESDELASIVLRGRESYSALNDVDKLRFEHVHFHLLNIIESHVFQSQRTAVDAEYRGWAIENMEEMARGYFAFPGSKEFWQGAENYFDSGVRDLVNRSLAN